ncbi:MULTISPECIES: hypothetical protein [unclassified Rhizobium]|uniref:hypothetical protein n=1 Tax=unclassified Rhizobium TaxID=2613769 RepID=UPI0011317BF7|nr:MULTISPECIES: hypothetical protein [unclassified Rhizobium]
MVESSASSAARVASLVEALISAGCDMWSVGTGYFMGEPREEPAATRAQEILREFGPRDHLKTEISNHLRAIGRDIARDFALDQI